jgi:hypothetical protein
LRMDGLHLRLGAKEYAATLKEKAYGDLVPGDPLGCIVTSVVPEEMRIFVSRKSLVIDSIRSQCGGKRVSAMVVHVKQNGARLALGHGIEGWLDAGEASWDRIDDMRQIVKVGQTISCVVKAETSGEAEELKLSTKVMTRAAYRVSGKVGLFRGASSINLRNIEQSVYGTIARKVFISFPRDQDRFEVRGDDPASIALAARMLEILASQKSCSLENISEDIKSAKLEGVTVRHKNTTRKAPRKVPEVPQPPKLRTVSSQKVTKSPIQTTASQSKANSTASLASKNAVLQQDVSIDYRRWQLLLRKPAGLLSIIFGKPQSLVEKIEHLTRTEITVADERPNLAIIRGTQDAINQAKARIEYL